MHHCSVTRKLLSVRHPGRCFISDTANQLAHFPVTKICFIFEIEHTVGQSGIKEGHGGTELCPSPAVTCECLTVRVPIHPFSPLQSERNMPAL